MIYIKIVFLKRDSFEKDLKFTYYKFTCDYKDVKALRNKVATQNLNICL